MNRPLRHDPMKPGFFLLLIFLMAPARAVDLEIRLPNQGDFHDVSRELGAAFSYKPLQPTEHTSILGFSLGGIGSYTPLEDDSAFSRLTGDEVEEIGTVGASLYKGLPFGFDLGGFYATVPGADVSLVGAELRYAIIEGGIAVPAIGLRGAYTRLTGVDDFELDTKSIDLSISKGFAFVTPYAGAGKVFVTSDPKSSFGLDEEDLDLNKLFAGIRVSLFPLTLTGEIDHTGDNTTYNLRLGVGL